MLQGGKGAVAIRCCGTGSLQQVRVIHLDACPLFWFCVASRPASLMEGADTPPHCSASRAAAVYQEVPGASAAVAMGPAAVRPRTVCSSREAGLGSTQRVDAQLQAKSKVWAAMHHAQLVSVPGRRPQTS